MPRPKFGPPAVQASIDWYFWLKISRPMISFMISEVPA